MGRVRDSRTLNTHCVIVEWIYFGSVLYVFLSGSLFVLFVCFMGVVYGIHVFMYIYTCNPIKAFVFDLIVSIDCL